MIAVQTPGERINSQTDKGPTFGKRLKNWADSLSMRKASESSDISLREAVMERKMYVIDQLLIETLEMFLNESGMSEVCL